MIPAGRRARILLIDTNVYFSKRLSDALKREGFEVNSSTQPAFALTTLEYDAPLAIVCSTNMREMGALDIARMIRADAKLSAMPVIALGDGSQRALMQAFQAGCDDYIDRTRPPAAIASHIRNVIVTKSEGFQPAQMLPQDDTSLSGSLSHHDLPSVMQMLAQAHQTGALHIHSGNTDAMLFFDAGSISHAECGALFGDEAVIHVLKSCFKNSSGIYKFLYGSSSTQRTVLRSSTDLMLSAMREVDESSYAAQQTFKSHPTAQEIATPPGIGNDSTLTVDAANDSTGSLLNDSFADDAGTEEPLLLREEDAPSISDGRQTSPSALISSEPAEAGESGLSDFVDSAEPALEDLCDGRHFPPSEGYFFANRRKTQEQEQTVAPQSAEEPCAEIVRNPDDCAAIADAIDRFAIRHSNDFSAADPDPDFHSLSEEPPDRESSASPHGPDNATLAADNASVATRSEEEL